MALIKIEGYGEFEMPESFKLKEMRIVERYSEGHMEGFELSKLAGMIHVAIARSKPDVSFDEIQTVVDDIEMDQLEKIMGDVEAGQSPPLEEPESKPPESGASLNGDSEESLEPILESETPLSSGSLDSVGFRSFHTKSES